MAHKIQPKMRRTDECPICDHLAGHVRMAATVLGQPMIIRLTVVCRVCQHEWVIDTVGAPETMLTPRHRLQDPPYR